MKEQSDDIVSDLRRDLAARRDLSNDGAMTMSAPFYTSEAFLAFEKTHLFHREWICLGHTGEIPNAGDYFTTEFADEHLIVCRGGDGEIRALSNVCRHRGNLVAEGRGNLKRFRCGYHAWAYGLDGALQTAPLMNRVEGFDRANCGLHSFQTEIWENFIFANLDGSAAPLAPRLEPLSRLMANYHNEQRHLVHLAEDQWETNWKALVENFLEGYHLSATHLETLHPISPTSLCKKFPGGDAYTGFHAYYDPSWPERGPIHEDLTEDERRNSIIACVYPMFVFAIATHYTLFLCLRPVTSDRVAFRWGVAGYDPDPDAQGVKDYVKLCEDFLAEDRAKLETMQRALKSRYYRPGPLAPDDFEGTIRDFLAFMADRLGGDE